MARHEVFVSVSTFNRSLKYVAPGWGRVPYCRVAVFAADFVFVGDE